MSTSQEQPLLNLRYQYPIYVHIILPFVFTYAGIFVMLSNHYILRPRAERLITSIITTAIVKDLLIDILSNLSAFSFLLSSILFTNNDWGVSTLLINDLYWCTLIFAIVVYRNCQDSPKTQPLSLKIIIKNVVLVCVCYGVFMYHYISKLYFITLGSVLLAIYIVNMVLIMYEQRFIGFIDDLFQIKKVEQITNVKYVDIQNYVNQNKFMKIQELCKQYPVTPQELENQMKPYRPKLEKIKIKNKAIVAEKLLHIALAIHISRQHLLSFKEKQVRQYYGSLNGTLQRKNTKGFSNKLASSMKQIIQDNENSDQSNSQQQQSTYSQMEIEDNTSILFYVFPIRIFESSRILSMVISLFLNISLGFALNFALQMAKTIKYGIFLKFYYALLLLPFLPNVSKLIYFNTMALSSIWKYAMAGLFLLISCSTNDLYLPFQPQKLLEWQFLTQAITMILMMIFLSFKINRTQKIVSGIFLLALGGHGALSYYAVQ